MVCYENEEKIAILENRRTPLLATNQALLEINARVYSDDIYGISVVNSYYQPVHVEISDERDFGIDDMGCVTKKDMRPPPPLQK